MDTWLPDWLARAHGGLMRFSRCVGRGFLIKYRIDVRPTDRDGEVTFEKELSYNYSYYYKDLSQEVT